MLDILFTGFLQLPPGTRNPDDTTPVDFSDPFNLIVFIFMPIVMIVGYILWRRMKKRDRDQH